MKKYRWRVTTDKGTYPWKDIEAYSMFDAVQRIMAILLKRGIDEWTVGIHLEVASV